MSESINKIKVKDITYDVEDSIARGSAIQDSSLQITTTPDSVSLSYTDLEGETFEIPIPTATTETAGVMSAEDKKNISKVSSITDDIVNTQYEELEEIEPEETVITGYPSINIKKITRECGLYVKVL